MKILLSLLAAMILTGCLVQTDNSVNGDASSFAPTPLGESKEFLQASAILKKNCATCHTHSEFAGYTEADFVSNDLVVPQDPAGSLLFQMLRGSGVGNGDMPKDAPALSRQDIGAIRNWISHIGAVAPTPSPSFPNTPFGQAQQIILTNCATCHKHQAWKSFQESDFISNQLVDPGSADGSVLYQNLNGANVPGVDPGEMPEGRPALSASQLETIAAWINQLPASEPSPSPSPNVSASPTPAPTPTPSPSSSVTLLNALQRTNAAIAVISNSCSDCHTRAKTASSTAFAGASVGAFANFTMDSDFITAGLLSPGNPGASWLIRSLKSYGDIATMPQSDDPLSASDEATLTAWIAGIGQP